MVTVRLDPVRVIEIGRSGYISRMTGAVIEEAPVITALTQGGVVFKRFEGVVLDAGWGRGEVAFRKFPDAESTFMDRGGRTCNAPNREVFSYEDRSPPGPGARERRRAGAVPDGALRTRVRRRAAPAGPRRADVSVLEPPSPVPPPPRRPQPPR